MSYIRPIQKVIKLDFDHVLLLLKIVKHLKSFALVNFKINAK